MLADANVRDELTARWQFLPARSAADSAPTVALLPGWGHSGGCWAPLLGAFRQRANVMVLQRPDWPAQATALQPWLTAIAADLPPRVVLAGWSLGGMLATQLAAFAPQRVAGVLLLATNPSFIQRADWPWAMPVAEFEGFVARVTRNPQAAARKFRALQAKGESTDLKAALERSALASADMAGLHCLGWLDNRELLSQLSCPVQHLFADGDALVPVAVSAAIRERHPEHRIAVINDCGHAFPIANSTAVTEAMRRLLRDAGFDQSAASDSDVDKRSVARSFSKAAETYDGVAHLQRHVADALTGLLPDQSRPSRVMDLGCGTGYSLPALRRQYPAASVLGLDIAEGMLRYVQSQGRAADACVCGDTEDLPLADRTIDGLFSSLSIQWSRNLLALFAEAARVTAPGGWFCLATLGPDTLKEMRSAWTQVDGYVHVNQFLSKAVVLQGLEGFWDVEADICEPRVLYYDKANELMRELKTLGASNHNRGRPGGLGGTARLRAFADAYEPFRQPQGLPATWEIWYLRLRRRESVI